MTTCGSLYRVFSLSLCFILPSSFLTFFFLSSILFFRVLYLPSAFLLSYFLCFLVFLLSFSLPRSHSLLFASILTLLQILSVYFISSLLLSHLIPSPFSFLLLPLLSILFFFLDNLFLFLVLFFFMSLPSLSCSVFYSSLSCSPFSLNCSSLRSFSPLLFPFLLFILSFIFLLLLISLVTVLNRKSTWQSPSTCSWTTRCSCSGSTVSFFSLTTGSPCAASNTCSGTVIH